MSTECPRQSLVPKTFALWMPPKGRTVPVGPEQHPVPLPAVPLPIPHEELLEGDPSDNAIGTGVYDYLRHFPDCPHNQAYAELLRDAYPHYLSEIGAQILMLDHKEVDGAYIRRKITSMKILALLDPENPGLQQRLGIEYYNLALIFTELGNCRLHLLKAMGCLQNSLKNLPDNPTTLNYLGQIDYLLGDFPAASRRWQGVIDQVADESVQEPLRQRIARMEEVQMPESPLIDDLEKVGEAMACYGKGEIEEAATILEIVEERGQLTSELPSEEFYYMLGICRGKNGDTAGAFEALDRALEMNPEYQPAIDAKETILDGRSL